ncbi:MAG: hypothetical protein BEN19_00720 [Epulopiscium sp. Nuni2H_MBin003]|nr:MAG: hypothetical protein BEN19_00720 [Epulopiscium sp. Nuni2H_MBin003]
MTFRKIKSLTDHKFTENGEVWNIRTNKRVIPLEVDGQNILDFEDGGKRYTVNELEFITSLYFGASIDLPIEEALKEETYQLYQATSQTPAIKRFATASKTNFQNDIHNQENFQTLLMGLQEIQ